MFEYLRPYECSEHCPCKRIEDGPYSVKWRKQQNGIYPVLQFDDPAGYFDRLFTDYAGEPTEVIFNDFRASGCWNWLLGWPEAEYFAEVIARFRASNLGIAPARDFDSSPARLLELLLVIDSERGAAANAKWKKDNP